MLNEPVLLIPAFRSGRETPWAGDILRHEYEKYTLGNMIGESYDFSVLSPLESTLPNGTPLSSFIKSLRLSKVDLPFLIKWVDVDTSTSLHAHPYDEYLYVVKAKKNSAAILELNETQPERMIELLESDRIDDVVHSISLNPGDVLHIPAGTPHALSGVTGYHIQPHCQVSFRLYDWNRVNSRGLKRSTQLDNASSFLRSKAVSHITPHETTLIETVSFQLLDLKGAYHLPIVFNGRFAVLTCLQSAQLTLESGKRLYLSAGQSVFMPHSNELHQLSGAHCLLAVAKV